MNLTDGFWFSLSSRFGASARPWGSASASSPASHWWIGGSHERIAVSGTCPTASVDLRSANAGARMGSILGTGLGLFVVIVGTDFALSTLVAWLGSRYKL
jgi:hypothetical protein